MRVGNSLAVTTPQTLSLSKGGYSMERIKEALTKAGIPYVTECLGGNIEGVRLGHGMYIVEHGSGEGYYVGTLEDENDACYTLEEALELAKA
jgi:hypothetical protein